MLWIARNHCFSKPKYFEAQPPERFLVLMPGALLIGFSAMRSFVCSQKSPQKKKKKKRTDTLGLVEERSKRDMSRSIVVDNEEGRLVGFETIVFLAGKPRLSNTCDA